MIVWLLKKGDIILANGEIAYYEQFLLLPQCFQKSSASGASESVCVWERVRCKIREWIRPNITRWGLTYLLHIILNPFIRQFCSRRLWTYFVKTSKISIIEWIITYDKKWKTLWQQEKLHILCNFFFCHYVFKKPSAAEASESVYMRERVKQYK